MVVHFIDISGIVYHF